MKVVRFNESFRYLGHQIRADGSGDDAMTNMTNTIKAMTNHMRKRTGDSPDAKYEVIKSVLLAKVVYGAKLQSALFIDNDEEILKCGTPSLVQQL